MFSTRYVHLYNIFYSLECNYYNIIYFVFAVDCQHSAHNPFGSIHILSLPIC